MTQRLPRLQAELLLACVNGDDLLGKDYPKQGRQRMALVAKKMIVIRPGHPGGYVPTDLGLATVAPKPPVPPVHPAKYRPSKQVGLLVEMINVQRVPHSGVGESERRFNDGIRHGLNITLRALVELETRITGSDLIDDICADLITESLINKC